MFSKDVSISFKSNQNKNSIFYKSNMQKYSNSLSLSIDRNYKKLVDQMNIFIDNIIEMNIDINDYSLDNLETFLNSLRKNNNFIKTMNAVGIGMNHFERLFTLMYKTRRLIIDNRNVTNLEVRCDEQSEILFNIDKLIEQIEKLKQRLKIFEDIDKTMTVQPVIDEKYLLYIRHYGFPENGIFDFTKLNLVDNIIEGNNKC